MPGRNSGGKKNSGSRNTFGKKLRAIRLAKDISLKDMAAKLEARGWEISEASYAHLESGRRIVSDTELIMILKVLRSRLSDLE